MKNLMNVLDCLKMCDRKRLYHEVFESYPCPEEEKRKESAYATLLLVEKLVKLKPIRNDFEFVILPRISYFYDKGRVLREFESSVFDTGRRKRLKRCNFKYKDYHTFLQTECLSLYEMKRFTGKSWKFGMSGRKGGSYIHCDKRKVLGFYLPMSVVKEIGLERTLSFILYEMTFFGYDIDDDSKKNDILDKMDELYEHSSDLIKDYESSFNDRENKEYVFKKEEDDINFERCHFINEVERINYYNMLVKDYNQK